jgi:hypothetical protein
MDEQHLAVTMLPGEERAYLGRWGALRAAFDDVNVPTPAASCGPSASSLMIRPGDGAATARAIRSVAGAAGRPLDLQLVALASRVERAAAARASGAVRAGY